MVRDEWQDEQEFLAELKARTGKDLAEWMAAISAQGFADKNETIDWLRSQGFPFARASRLERVHSNGGKPIYASRPSGRSKTNDAPIAPEGDHQKANSLRPQRDSSLVAGDPEVLERLLSAAKGYRPLYHLLEEEMRKSLPNAVLTPKPTYISIGAPAEFAAVSLHPTEIRVGLDLGDRAFDAHLQRSRLKTLGGSITHMLLLTDARQVNADLMALLQAACDRVNG
jgi:hypothetical protein